MKWSQIRSRWGDDEAMSYDAISKAIDRSLGDPAAMAYWGALAVQHPDVRRSPVLWPSANLVYGRGLRESAKGGTQELTLARKAFEDACAGYERTQNKESLAKALHELGLLLGSEGYPGDPVQNLEESLVCHRRCLELSVNKEGRAIASYEVGRSLSRRTTGDSVQNIDAAIGHLETAARLYDSLRWPFYRADALTLLSECYEKRVRGSCRDSLESAIEHCSAALNLCDERSGWNEWLNTTQTLGRLYTRKVAHTQAEDDERAPEILHRALRGLDPETDPAMASSLHHALGITYRSRERDNRAENAELVLRHLTESLHHLDPVNTPENWRITHQALASAYEYRVPGDHGADLDRAVEHLEAALRSCDRDGDPGNWAMIQQSMALVYGKRARDGSPKGDRRSDRARARAAVENVLTVRTRKADPQGWARAMVTRAGLEEGGQQPPVPDERVGSRAGSSGEADRLTALGRTVADLRLAVRARDRDTDPEGWALGRIALEGALAGLMAAGGSATGYDAGNSTGNGTGNDAAGHDQLWEECVALLIDALEVFTPDGHPERCKDTAGRLGQALADRGCWAEAADAFQLSLEAAESSRPVALALLDRRRQPGLLNGLPRFAAYCLARAGQLTEAVAVLERGRADTLGDTLDHDHQSLEKLRNDHPQLHRFYCDAAERLRRIRNAEDPPGPAGEPLTELARRTHAARESLAGAVRRIRIIPGYQDFLEAPGLVAVEAAVGSDTPIAYLDTTPWGTVTLLVTRTDTTLAIEPLWHDLNLAELNDLLHRSAAPDSVFPMMAGYLRLPYDIVESGSFDGNPALTQGSLWADPDAVLRTGREEFGRLDAVGRTVVARLGRALADSGAASVVLIPCGTLGILPLHTLAYDGERCLIDDFGVTFAPSARMLVSARESAAGDWPDATLAGVGNPLPHDRPLSFADRELNMISWLFQQSACLHGQYATKERLLSAASSATHVHLACHGQVPFLTDEQPYLELAGGERLALEEIARAQPFPAARMVVLSACQSALVGSLRNPDEALGLPTAVMLAGTPGVIGTLWPVNDLSACLLMERFYILYLGGGASEGAPMAPWQALARAQRWLSELPADEVRARIEADPALRDIAQENEARSPGARSAMAAFRGSEPEDRHGRPFADPVYWAPYIYVGA